MFLVVYTYLKPLETVDEFLAEHRAYLDKCYADNCLIVSGPKKPRTGAVLISQLTSKSKLIQILENDPFIIRGIAAYEVTEFESVKYHANFLTFVE